AFVKVIKTIQAMRSDVRAARAGGKTVGVVPTMGALHAGHVSLIDAARRACDYVVVTIFVNPTQFAPTEDLGAYPRTLEADLGACGDHGADATFVPDADEMYPTDAMTEIHVRTISERLCGRDRPVHFGGVCTVVAKLFNIVPADKAFFGQKDFQQTVVVKRMVADLNFPVEIVVCPTVREADGLAMSSRNVYLTPAQRRQAPALYGALQRGRDLIARSHPPAEQVAQAMRRHLAADAPDGQIDYVAIVNPSTLENVESTDGPVAMALAVRLGRARLIDNVVIE
ncbi:MAG: pantoate--beta-alanine ligase, partial [Planctomycetota bacterium]